MFTPNYSILDNDTILDGGDEYDYDMDYHNMNDPDMAPELLDVSIRYLLVVAYVLIIVAAVIMNLMVLIVVGRNRKLRTVTNTFLMSLALSDLLIAVLNMPFQVQHYIQNEWTTGLFMCKFSSYIQSVVINVSILTLAAVAFDRFYAICYPLRARHVHTTRRAGVILCSLWAIAMLVSVPNYMFMLLSPEFSIVGEDRDILFFDMCKEHFPNRGLMIVYTVLIYTFLYLLPTILMVVAYGRVSITLWSRTPIGEHNQGDDSRSQESKRIVRMLILLVAVFAISWFPFFTMQVVILRFTSTDMGNVNVRLTMALLHLLGYSNACVNPALYCFMNESFQRELLRSITSCCSRQKPRSHVVASSAFSDEKTTLSGGGGRRKDRQTEMKNREDASTIANGGTTTLSLIVTTTP